MVHCEALTWFIEYGIVGEVGNSPNVMEIVQDMGMEDDDVKFVEHLLSHRRISDIDIAHMDSLRQVGILIPKIYESIAVQVGGFNCVSFTKRDMYNEVRRQRSLHNGDVNAMLRFLEVASRRDEKIYLRGPKAVIIYGDRSMRIAIHEVFFDAHHRLCA
ncbi:hypothetical protein Ahy_A09g043499 [Arachis hypogaea]|uniref:Uncharacterized protein n=1 Tax=Arachis hypogaea TaxID=3818 RepID=A0A445BIE5_ARAHY|nr:hypothetical protein Ahy_A09g043499 [Arachis hypogaea]